MGGLVFYPSRTANHTDAKTIHAGNNRRATMADTDSILEYITVAAEVTASEIVRSKPSLSPDWADIKQTLIIHAWKKMGGGYDTTRSKPETFITAIMRNMAYSILRERQKHVFTTGFGDEIENSHYSVDLPESLPCEITDGLSARSAAAAELLAEGMTKKAVAKKIGVSVWILKTRILPEIRLLYRK